MKGLRSHGYPAAQAIADDVAAAPTLAALRFYDGRTPAHAQAPLMPVKRPLTWYFLVRPLGFEPRTCGLRVRCSAVELEAHRPSRS